MFKRKVHVLMRIEVIKTKTKNDGSGIPLDPIVE
jgi:hypothetical protein